MSMYDSVVRRLRPAPSREVGTTATLVLTVLLIAALVGVAMFVRSAGDAHPRPRLVVLFAYSALDDVLSEGLLPAFRERWKTEHGEDVEFVTTYGGSPALTRRILREVPAQVAILTSSLDARRLAPRVVRPSAWAELPHGGRLARTPLVLRVRPGNPLGIRGLADLVRGDVTAIRIDPASSGLGECLLLATYGAGRRSGLDERATLDAVTALLAAEPPPARTAREATRRFLSGEGDVCVAYEHDAVRTPSRPHPRGDVVRPAHTLVCEPVVVILRRHVAEPDRPLVQAFAAWLFTDEAQAILGAWGLHGPEATPAEMGLEDAFTLEELEAPEALLETLRAGGRAE